MTLIDYISGMECKENNLKWIFTRLFKNLVDLKKIMFGVLLKLWSGH